MAASATLLLAAAAAATTTAVVTAQQPQPQQPHGCTPQTLPELTVPRCNDGRATAILNKRLGTLAADFPEATVELCYTPKTFEMTFEAARETSFLVDNSLENNDPIWMWTVMEAFISLGPQDPIHYLEFEVAPNNRLWTGFIHNPHKNFTDKSTAFVDDWETYPIQSITENDWRGEMWKSSVSLPLSMFNVERPEGTLWRMNFFRTYYKDDSSEQEYGAWNPNRLISFHQTPCFGRIAFAGGGGGGGPPPPAQTNNAVGPHGCTPDSVPSLNVPHCNDGKATATINKRLGTLAADFPPATVTICYTNQAIELIFSATSETSYLVNITQKNNDPIWMWTVMEAFIGLGSNDPTEYLEFEVAPNNRLWTGFIHNPHKNFTSKATAFVEDWDLYPIKSSTTRDVNAQTWTSMVSLPLSMFNVERPQGTTWRMNFFRTYYRDANAPQEYGAWNPNKLISFHQTPCFGYVRFDGEALGPNGSGGGNTIGNNGYYGGNAGGNYGNSGSWGNNGKGGSQGGGGGGDWGNNGQGNGQGGGDRDQWNGGGGVGNGENNGEGGTGTAAAAASAKSETVAMPKGFSAMAIIFLILVPIECLFLIYVAKKAT